MTFRQNTVDNNLADPGVLAPGFIDVFAGAGGLSLGLMQAGWRGLLAVEKSPMAFSTLKFNLIDGDLQPKYDWPAWFPQQPADVEQVCEAYRNQLEQLRPLPLLAGGPPCQGFSRAGKREQKDERNLLVNQYLQLIDIVQPMILLIENVAGFAEDFIEDKTKENDYAPGNEAERKLIFNADAELRRQLEQRGYIPFVKKAVAAKTFGVPQMRPRYILIGIRREYVDRMTNVQPIERLYESRNSFLDEHNLSDTLETSVEEAIGDLLRAHGTVKCAEQHMGAYQQGLYGPETSSYQRLLRKDKKGSQIETGQPADSHRFARHGTSTVEKFQRIITDFTPGVQLREKDLEGIGTKKHRIAPLAATKVCHTLTSLPDDLVHYCEPRILTVREYARIQSFPDWFHFKSNYTTGGQRRRTEVPRYTQVANAVPPLLAHAIGLTLLKLYNEINQQMAPVVEGPEQGN